MAARLAERAATTRPFFERCLLDYHGLGDGAEKWHSVVMTPAHGPPILLSFGMALACSAVLLPASPAHAIDAELLPSQPKEPAQPLAKRLQTHDQTELLLLVDELAPGADTDSNVRAVAELLRAGQPDVVTDHALDALARLGSREAREVLIAFTRHRRPQARRRAYTALAQLKDGRDAMVLSVLTQGLRDSAPEVRNNAARWLG